MRKFSFLMTVLTFGLFSVGFTSTNVTEKQISHHVDESSSFDFVSSDVIFENLCVFYSMGIEDKNYPTGSVFKPVRFKNSYEFNENYDSPAFNFIDPGVNKRQILKNYNKVVGKKTHFDGSSSGGLPYIQYCYNTL